jgi:CRP/FNR family nitrogen fixation transcriptional regulator
MNAIAFNTVVARPVVLERPPVVPPVAGEGGVRMTYGRDEEIFGEGEASRYVYRVITGAVRTYRVLSDGRRQIVEFHTAGDLFGLDGERCHALGAEAVRETTLQVVRREAFLHEQGSEAAISALLKKFHRAQAHMLLLGRHTACERVASFLLDFRARAGADAFDLPMSRQDIADYLGLTIETVSRTFTQLQAAHQIDLASCRRVVLRNPAALERICE